jgi:hypothetical protein
MAEPTYSFEHITKGEFIIDYLKEHPAAILPQEPEMLFSALISWGFLKQIEDDVYEMGTREEYALLCDSLEGEMNELEKRIEKLRAEWDSD